MNVPSTSTGKPDVRELAASDLADLVARLRRAMRRAARRTDPDLALSVAQLELMTAIASMPGARSGELASSLRVAPNSVSTLAHDLVRLGMLERRRGTTDRRTVELALTDLGHAALARWQTTNEELIHGALTSLSADERRRIERALPALRRLVGQLDARADAP